MNKIFISGNLVEDSKQIQTKLGKMLTFTVANNTKVLKREHTTYYKCTISDYRACGKLPTLLKKGIKVSLSGTHQFDIIVDKEEDTTYYNNKIMVEDIDVLMYMNQRKSASTTKQNSLPQISSGVEIQEDDGIKHF